MGYQLWLSPYTGLRRRGTTFKEMEALFINQITTKFIYEPLFSCRMIDSAQAVKEELTNRDFDYAGIVDDNERITAYCLRDELGDGTIERYAKSFVLSQVISDSTPLSKLFTTLKNEKVSFVNSWNEIKGIITIWDVNKPIVRIYLFGIISLMEMHLNYWIDSFHADNSWMGKLKEERIQDAHKTLADRKGSNDALSLVECLQLCDKKEILADSKDFLAEFGYSKNAIERMLRRGEKIRNELAHSQNSITSNVDWSDFVDTIASMEAFLKTSEDKLEQKILRLPV